MGRSACDRSRSSVPSSELAGPRPRLRAERDNVERADAIVSGHKVKRHLSVEIDKIEWHEFKEATAGRPGPNTRYLKKTKTGWRLSWRMNEDAITYDRASDGMYPSCRARHDGYYAACRIMPRRSFAGRVLGVVVGLVVAWESA